MFRTICIIFFLLPISREVIFVSDEILLRAQQSLIVRLTSKDNKSIYIKSSESHKRLKKAVYFGEKQNQQEKELILSRLSWRCFYFFFLPLRIFWVHTFKWNAFKYRSICWKCTIKPIKSALFPPCCEMKSSTLRHCDNLI